MIRMLRILAALGLICQETRLEPDGLRAFGLAVAPDPTPLPALLRDCEAARDPRPRRSTTSLGSPLGSFMAEGRGFEPLGVTPVS